ncbi:MAG TPA: class I SAM-dependent methyltransferase [Methanothermobacter sp.]|nr:class I SAM-dependent methyltransferase [Methanothermobacter sp.]
MNILERPNITHEKLQQVIESAFNGMKTFNLIKSSIEMGVFENLNEPLSYEELSKKLGIEPIFSYHVLEALEKIGLITKENGVYNNSELSKQYLNSKSEYYRGNCILSLKENVDQWNNLTETLKGNLSKKEESFFPQIIQVMAEDCISGELQDTVEIIASYDEFMNSKTLLDLAGGHGMYSIAFSKINPNIDCFVFDLPPVTHETKKYIQKYGSNVKTMPGNFYQDELGGPYDVIFSSYNPGGKNPEIAKKVYNSLNEDGLFITKQYFPENENQNLADVLDNLEWNFAKFEKSMKANTRYSFKGDLQFNKYLEFLRNLGFEIIDVHHIDHLNPSFGTKSRNKLIISKKVS